MCEKRMDVVLVIDESGSMTYDMPAMKAFAKEIVGSFAPLGDDNAHFAVVGFDTDATLHSTPNASMSHLHTAIDNMHAWGGTSISDGLARAHTVFNNYHRAGATKIVLTLSDGEQNRDCNPSCSQAPIDAAAALKTDGITVFSWGFGGVSVATLEGIASDPAKVKYSAELSGLLSFGHVLRTEACAVDLPPPAPPSQILSAEDVDAGTL